jgi:RNA polymerase sigma-70 factor (ECF subfamily)
LFRIATNLVRDRLRRTRTTLGLPTTAAENELREFPDDGETADPSRRMQAAEAADRLQQALSRLSDAEREVVMLRHFSELSFKEIAEMMNTPLGTALARAHRGLGRLRQLMAESGD